MLPELTWLPWVVLAGAAALVLVPRLGVLKTLAASLAGVFHRETNVPDIQAKVDAYHVLAADLPPELARQVWASIGVVTPSATAGEATHENL